MSRNPEGLVADDKERTVIGLDEPAFPQAPAPTEPQFRRSPTPDTDSLNQASVASNVWEAA